MAKQASDYKQWSFGGNEAEGSYNYAHIAGLSLADFKKSAIVEAAFKGYSDKGRDERVQALYSDVQSWKAEQDAKAAKSAPQGEAGGEKASDANKDKK